MALVLPDTYADEIPGKFIQILKCLQSLAAIAKAARQRADAVTTGDRGSAEPNGASGGVADGGHTGAPDSGTGSDSDLGKEERS